jgi:hypothetical protein
MMPKESLTGDPLTLRAIGPPRADRCFATLRSDRHAKRAETKLQKRCCTNTGDNSRRCVIY